MPFLPRLVRFPKHCENRGVFAIFFLQKNKESLLFFLLDFTTTLFYNCPLFLPFPLFQPLEKQKCRHVEEYIQHALGVNIYLAIVNQHYNPLKTGQRKRHVGS